jgi:hypothetical protein
VRLKGISVTGALLVATLVAASPAAAQTIGANLNRAANNPAGCEFLPTTTFDGFRQYFFSGTQSCTYVGTGNLGGQETAGAIGPGVLTAVRIKAASPTGPMRVTILRATRSGVGFACCFFAAESATFTPAANATTQVNLRLPMRSDLDPNFGETVDYMALTVLAPGVPVPGFDGGIPGDVTRSSSLAFFPHVRPGDSRVDGAGVTDFVPLIQGNFASICGASALRAKFAARYRRGAAGCLGALQIGGSVARRDGGDALMRLLCNDANGCRGRLTLVGSGGRARLAKRGSGPTYAKSKFNLAPGAEQDVGAKLTRAGKALLRERRSSKVKAKVKLRGAYVSKLSAKLKLKR